MPSKYVCVLCAAASLTGAVDSRHSQGIVIFHVLKPNNVSYVYVANSQEESTATVLQCFPTPPPLTEINHINLQVHCCVGWFV